MTRTGTAAPQAGMTLAQDRLNAGDIAGASALCIRALAADPANAQALHILALIAIRQGNAPLAIERLRRACASDGAPAACFSNLAELLRQARQYDEAEAAARKAVARNEKFSEGQVNLGVILFEAGKLEESKACLQQLIRREPDNAQAHNSLAMTYMGLGDTGKAEKHWKLALAKAPGFSTPASNLANLYTMLGSLEEAVRHGRIAVQGRPRMPDAFLNFAAALNGASNFQGALTVLDEGLKEWPGDPRLWSARTSVLNRLELPVAALESAERSVRLNPSQPEAQFGYATALRTVGRAEEAVEVYQRAADLASGMQREKALLGRALTFNEVGKARDASQALTALIEEFPNSAPAIYYNVQFAKFRADDPLLEHMLTMRGNAGDEGDAAILLDFALGKAFIDIGEDERAFEHFHRGNRLKRKAFNYDPRVTTQWFERIAAMTSGDVIASGRTRQVHPKAPVFVVGPPRSGTTLIEQILASHSRVHGAGELKLIDRLAQPAGGFPDMLKDSRTLRGHIDRLGAQYMAEIKRLSPGRSHVIDKMPSNFIYLGLIAMAFPGAKIIHARRNAIDTCLSLYWTLFADEQAFSYDMTELAQFYKDYERLTQHWEAVIPASQLLSVNYEDMVHDPEMQSRRLIDFLGLDWEDACLKFHRPSARSARQASTRSGRRCTRHRSADGEPMSATSVRWSTRWASAPDA